MWAWVPVLFFRRRDVKGDPNLKIDSVQDAEATYCEADSPGFTGPCLGYNRLITTHNEVQQLTVSQKRRMRQKRRVKRWEEKMKELQAAAKA